MARIAARATGASSARPQARHRTKPGPLAGARHPLAHRTTHRDPGAPMEAGPDGEASSCPPATPVGAGSRPMAGIPAAVALSPARATA